MRLSWTLPKPVTAALEMREMVISGVRAGLAVCLVAASVAIAGACSTSAAPPEPSLPKPVAAQVIGVLGTVQMTYKGARSPLAVGAEVVPTDVVETGSASAAELGFHGASLHLGPSSSLYVVQAIRKRSGWQLQVAIDGSWVANVPSDVRLIVYGGHSAATTTAAAAFNATSGAGSQSLTLRVSSGSVSVAGLGGGAVVHAGQSASVAAPTPDRPRPVPVVAS